MADNMAECPSVLGLNWLSKMGLMSKAKAGSVPGKMRSDKAHRKRCCCGMKECHEIQDEDPSYTAAFHVPKGVEARIRWTSYLCITSLLDEGDFRVCGHHFRYEHFDASSAQPRSDGKSPTLRLSKSAIPNVPGRELNRRGGASVEDCFRWRVLCEVTQRRCRDIEAELIDLKQGHVSPLQAVVETKPLVC